MSFRNYDLSNKIGLSLSFGEINKNQVSYSTINRLLKKHNLVGKTFTLRSFKESLNSSLYHVVYIPLSTGGVMDFYRGLAYGLGEETKFRKVDMFRQIQQGIERMDLSAFFSIIITYEIDSNSPSSSEITPLLKAISQKL